jgi:hypothetical protein
MQRAFVVLALILGWAAGAHAQPWSLHPPLCRTVYPGDQSHVYNYPGLFSSLPYDAKVICPIPDTSDRPDSQVSEVRVYIARNSIHTPQQFAVRACRTARTSLGYACGPPAFASVESNVITLDPRPIWEPTDFGYLEVTFGNAASDGVYGYALIY